MIHTITTSIQNIKAKMQEHSRIGWTKAGPDHPLTLLVPGSIGIRVEWEVDGT